MQAILLGPVMEEEEVNQLEEAIEAVAALLESDFEEKP